ncbi:CGNR zinc finger domain-containing protein [Jiangella gansuensis]|uniref:CGNR zinc finger domain-containing protein n=1 Tax=Jiangella gansuensis TaxID=281473 RepID=UPI00047E02AF|nr:ABATE domain-containing protein [Jiangella gansuensis]
MSAATAWVDDHFIAGDVALDFANTVYRRTPELGADLLNTAEALTTWLARAHLLPESNEHGDPADVLDEARGLRAQLWVVFDAQREGRAIPEDAFARLLDVARHGIGSVTLKPDGSMVPTTADGALSILALRATARVLNPPPQGVRVCDRCGWFFIDSSRGRRRRWCSMKTCGNQAKAHRYRSTHG